MEIYGKCKVYDVKTDVKTDVKCKDPDRDVKLGTVTQVATRKVISHPGGSRKHLGSARSNSSNPGAQQEAITMKQPHLLNYYHCSEHWACKPGGSPPQNRSTKGGRQEDPRQEAQDFYHRAIGGPLPQDLPRVHLGRRDYRARAQQEVAPRGDPRAVVFTHRHAACLALLSALPSTSMAATRPTKNRRAHRMIKTRCF